jgi:hypothetical protein
MTAESAETAPETRRMWAFLVGWGALWVLGTWRASVGALRPGWFGIPTGDFVTEVAGGLGYLCGAGAVWTWLRRRETNPDSRVLPRGLSYGWRSLLITGLAHGLLTLPVLVFGVVVGALLPGGQLEDGGDYFIAVSHWLVPHFFLGLPAGPLAAAVVGLTPLFVLWLVAAVHLHRLAADDADREEDRNRFVALGLTALAFVILGLIAGLVVLPTFLTPGPWAGTIILALAVLLVAACAAAMAAGWRLGSRPWHGPLRGGPPRRVSLRAGLPFLLVRGCAAVALGWFLVTTVREAFGG